MTDSAGSAQPVFSRRSTAQVRTDRPSRYGKQLASHMGRKITTTWDEASQTGSLTFDREGAATGWPPTTRTSSASSRSLESTWPASAPRRASS